MKSINTYVKEARETIRVADYLVTQTFTLAKDPKVLLSALNNIKISHEHIVDAIIEHDLFKKTLTQVKDREARYTQFKNIILKKQLTNEETLKVIETVLGLWKEHKESPVEFARAQQVVVCTDNYHLTTINEKVLTDLINKTKQLIEDLFGKSTGT